jgi:hypothetical protein
MPEPTTELDPKYIELAEHLLTKREDSTPTPDGITALAEFIHEAVEDYFHDEELELDEDEET